MTHEEARTLASALADGELDARGVTELTSHLAGCGDCGMFPARVRSLSALAAALPAEATPSRLADRVVAELRGVTLPRRRPRLRVGLAFAAALAVALVAVFGGLPLRTFRLPAAEAARALQQIRTFSIEREVTDFTTPGGPRTSVETFWFRAPGFIRIERRSGSGVDVEIRRPGERYVKTSGGAFREIGLPPDANPVPEPLSPTIAILGERLGPGPEVAGRRTVRVELRFGDRERRTALVDATSLVVLGAERYTILRKERFVGDDLAEQKRTISVRYNPPVDDALFAIPPIAPVDQGFRTGGLQALATPPRAAPEGLSLIQAGNGPLGGAALFARGAFGVLVTVDGAPPPGEATVRRPATVAGRAATLVLSLFDVPSVLFDIAGHSVSVAAPLPPEQLVALASAMFPAE